MSVNFTISKQFTKDLEGGYWNDTSGGHTYAGITYKYYPSWKGWQRLFTLAAQKFGGIARVPRYTEFRDAELNMHIETFYRSRYWNKLMNGNLFRNQDIANIVYDFLVHKENDAIAVINYVAKQINNLVIVSKTRIAPAVITIANNAQQKFYSLLRFFRKQYYGNPKSIPGTSIKKFSNSLVTAFVERVNKFPIATGATMQFPLFKLPFSV